MEQQQVLRVIKSLVDLETKGMHVNSINTEMVPDSEDPDFIEPVVSIKYDNMQQEHEVRVYAEGSMSDF